MIGVGSSCTHNNKLQINNIAKFAYRILFTYSMHIAMLLTYQCSVIPRPEKIQLKLLDTIATQSLKLEIASSLELDSPLPRRIQYRIPRCIPVPALIDHGVAEGSLIDEP